MKILQIGLIISAVIGASAYSPATSAAEKSPPSANDMPDKRPEAKGPQRPAGEQQSTRRKTRCFSCRILM